MSAELVLSSISIRSELASLRSSTVDGMSMQN